MVVEFRSDKGELDEGNGKLELDVPVIDMTVYCPASVVDVADSSSEHDSVQAASEVVCARVGAVSNDIDNTVKPD